MRDSGAESAKDMGAAMKQAMAAVDGRADGKRVSGLVRAALAGMRTQIELPNDVAAELAGSQDAVLRALEAHLDCKVFLRGNLLTLDGEESETHAGERVVRELSELIARGHQIGPGTIAAVTGALDAHESPARVLEDVVWRHRGLRVAPKTVNQKRYVDSIRDNTITFGVGPAGTGKTFLAVAMAAAALSRHEVNRIILTRPAVEAGERLGFLPGDLMAKVDPYLRPLFDALHDMLDPEKVSQHIERGVIEIAPLAFMRGRTLNDSFVILDEAQNTTPEQMKMFLTRLGFGSRMVVTGDITQVDLPREQRSGLIAVGDVLDSIEGIEFVRFGGEDVVRHKLVQRIVEAYDVHAQREPPAAPGDRARPADPQRLSAMLEVEVLGAGRCPPPRRRSTRCGACARRPPHARDRATGTSRSSSSTSARIAELNARPPRPPAPTDVLSFPIDGVGADAPARASSATSSSAPSTRADLREAVVHGDAAPARDGPRDRPRRDARAAGELLARERVRVTRSGFVALAGRPNVGKSTFVNAVVGEKVAIVSDRPQTTRRAIRGRARRGDCQIVLVDLPGVQRPRDALTARMAARVRQELEGADAALLMLNARAGRRSRRPLHRARAARPRGPVTIAVNKIDRSHAPRCCGALAAGRRARAGRRGVPDLRAHGCGRRGARRAPRAR